MSVSELQVVHKRSLTDRLIANLDAPDQAEFLTLLFADKRETFSYADLLKRSWCWTRFYQSKGIKPGDRVVIILKHSIDLYTSFIGAILGGIVPSMFAFPSPKFSEKEYFKTIGALFDNAQPRGLVTYPELRSTLPETISALVTRIVPEDVALTNVESPQLIPRDPEDIVLLQYSSGTTGLKK